MVDSLKYCQRGKGLNICSWCLMPGHLHLIANTSMKFELADVIRNFKKYTSKALIRQIQNEPEIIRE